MNEIIDFIVGIVALLLCMIPVFIIAAKLLKIGQLMKHSDSNEKSRSNQ